MYSTPDNNKHSHAISMELGGEDLVVQDKTVLVVDDDALVRETIMDIRQINPNVKIIAISGQGWSGPVSYLDLAKQLGADSALSKPFSKSELLQTVGTVMKKKECHPISGHQ